MDKELLAINVDDKRPRLSPFLGIEVLPLPNATWQRYRLAGNNGMYRWQFYRDGKGWDDCPCVPNEIVNALIEQAISKGSFVK